ncbi:50S ribosomal protein L5 [Candidatus Woesearchaeota archaeon]|nr:50S ribosomal protein L5 [Candidatus Woesearchaeota archaeon]
MNVMKQIKIEKMTLNVGAGKDPKKLEKGVMLLKHLTGIEPVKTVTQKRIPTWGLRPGLPIGCKLTIRDQERIKDLLTRFLKAKNNTLKESQLDDNGNVSFGIHEYIDIPGAQYNPEVGIMGFEVCVTLRRPGFRVKVRKIQKRKIKKSHRISKQDAIAFMKEKFQIKTGDE